MGLVVGRIINARATGPCPNGCNVLLIMVDTLSANHMDLYGYDRATMPKTAAFFSKGVVFDNAYSAAPWTFASFPSMYFSDLSSTISYQDLEGHTTRATMQSALRDHGVTVRGSLQPPSQFIVQTVDLPFKQDEQFPLTANLYNKTDLTTKVFTDAATELHNLEKTPTKRFFMMAHTFQVHDPYMPADPYDTFFASTTVGTVTMNDLLKVNLDISTHVSSHKEDSVPYALRYDQGLAQLDQVLDAFLGSLSKETLKNTVIILAADHGEAFGEHEFFWHGHSLYDEEMHVPLAMYVPNMKPMRVTEPVSLLDIAPTILSLERVPVPATFTGRSLLPLFSGGTLGNRVLRFENGYPSFLSQDKLKPGVKPPATLEETGVLNTTEHLINQTEIGVRSGDILLFTDQKQTLLFDLAKDPQEKDNLYTAVPPSLSEVFSTLQKILKQNTQQ